jgi:NADH:ubiquinone oxidoreductase subunit B-like Fe-S oxidoreductase
MLMGFTFIRHSVWVFNGAAHLLSHGCRSADLLIVDSAFLEKLASNWRNVAEQAMRNPQIVVHDRSTYKLRNLS